jgi:exopolyphosphatase/guanosine-5'-triphosphate,3'-diphosphate pyrophosphatase
VRYAAIDVGTNAARLNVVEVKNGKKGISIERIFQDRVALRLGDDVFKKGYITSHKSLQFIKTMRAFKLLSEVHEAQVMRAVATSAMREAENGAELRNMIFEQCGIYLETISGEEEALLLFESFDLLSVDRNLPYLVVDVGGGSTEISVFENGKRRASRSFELGTLRILNEKVTSSEWQNMRDWLEREVDHNVPHRLYGTGGNIRKIHALVVGKEEQAPVTMPALQQLLAAMEPLSNEERMLVYNIKADRADVIVPAMHVFKFILNQLGILEVHAPRLSLSDGILLHLYREQNDR